MGVKRLDDLIAYQRAVAFKEAVYAVFETHPAAARDWRYRSQVYEAAASVESNIAEAWGRRSAGEKCQLLSYSLGSLFEAERRRLDGAARSYFKREDCEPALAQARRCLVATTRLRKSLEPFAKHRGTRPGNRIPRSSRERNPRDP
jgi:four helix bundle protein